MSPIAAVRSHDPVSPSRGVAKPRGVDNAELQHQRHAEKKSAAAQPSPAAVVTLGGTPARVTYSRDGSAPASAAGSDGAGSTEVPVTTGKDGASSTTDVADGARVHVNTRGGASSGGGALIVGEGASVHVNTRGDASVGGGTLTVGAGASVHVNTRGDASVGGGTLTVGAGASVHVNTRGDSATTGVASVPDGASVKQLSRAANEPAAGSSSAAADPGPTAWRPFSASAYRTAQRAGTTPPEALPPPEVPEERARAASATPDGAPGFGFAARLTRRENRAPAPEPADPRLHLLRELVDGLREPATRQVGAAAKDEKALKAAERAEAKASDVKDGAEGKSTRRVDDAEARRRDGDAAAAKDGAAKDGAAKDAAAKDGAAKDGAAKDGAAKDAAAKDAAAKDAAAKDAAAKDAAAKDAAAKDAAAKDAAAKDAAAKDAAAKDAAAANKAPGIRRAAP